MKKVLSVAFDLSSGEPEVRSLQECTLSDLSTLAQAVSDELRDRRNRPPPPPEVEGQEDAG